MSYSKTKIERTQVVHTRILWLQVAETETSSSNLKLWVGYFVYWFPMAAITNDHKHHGTKQHKCITL